MSEKFEENVEEKKEIEIVSDDGSTLDISDVSDTINIVKRDDDKPKNIVIPQERKWFVILIATLNSCYFYIKNKLELSLAYFSIIYLYSHK